ncbi:MAG TPA: DJ-1/PfpI family protein [Terriglobia bacterium]|nr:DJ-1/PfpI family protein [Terriglobia bacterium]
MMKTVAILAMPGVQLLDVSGPLDVFAEANLQAGKQVYRLEVVAAAPGPLTASSGTRLLPDRIIGGAAKDEIDTLLVAGCPNAAELHPEPRVIAWLQRNARLSRRYGSVCTGAFFLAAAGLLENRQVTTHWSVADRLAAAYPSVTVAKDAIHVRDGKLRTAAGVTAGLDLALSLVEEDLGRELAKTVAGRLVMFFKRPGGQLQFSRKSEALPAGRSALQELQRFIAANPSLHHDLAGLAARVGLSPRHFARVFRSEVGTTPAAWVEAARVAAARPLLETRHGVPKQVAVQCGFANADMLRRAFVRHVGVTPAEYRKRYLDEAD